jgi:hypothetical protein
MFRVRSKLRLEIGGDHNDSEPSIHSKRGESQVELATGRRVVLQLERYRQPQPAALTVLRDLNHISIKFAVGPTTKSA